MAEKEPDKRDHQPAYQTRELYRPLFMATLLMIIVFATGIVGYTIIGGANYTVIDAIYMTVITLTTVGYGEIIDMSQNPGGRMFTVFLLFGGVGTFVYFFSSLTGFVVEGHLEKLFWRRRMNKAIDHLSNHYIVCGGGFTGRHIVKELLATNRPFVLIERSEEHVHEFHDYTHTEFPVVIGDATDDVTLMAAAIDRAQGLFACVANDKDNLIVTVSARMLNQDLKIVARAIDETVEQKMRKAGADAVVSPNMIGGLRMISEMVRPTVVSFLDVMLRDKDKRLRVEESRIEAGSDLDGKSVRDLRQRSIRDLLLVAVRLPNGEWLYNPDDEAILGPDMNLVYMASPSAREAIDQVARLPHR